MNKSLVIIILLSSLSFMTIKNPCYVLPIMENDSKRTIQWGDKEYLPNSRIPHGVHDYMVFSVPTGTDIKSFTDGTVISSSYDTLRFGKTITIEHDSNIVSFYGHIDTSFVSIGQKVNCGDIIGRTGSSGRTAGPNLYFKVTKDSISINPMEKIK